jgi:hypothetical protein
MLSDLRCRVADEGALVLAIENKFGLKYFSGAAEDHTGVRFDGIEGYRGGGDRSPRTLGRVELEASLKRAGFESVEFYFPFPDYKFVRSVISAEAAADGGPQLAELISQELGTDYSSFPALPLFNQRAAWHEVVRNGLLPDFANSFLVVASPTGQAKVRAPWDIATFTMGPRRPAYWATARVSGLAGAEPTVVRSRLTDLPQESGPVTMAEGSTETWLRGESVAQRAADVAMRRDADVGSVAEAMRPWVKHLQDAADMNSTLPGDYLDATPGNIVITGNRTTYIDREWSWSGRLSVQSVVVRGLVLFYVKLRDTGALAGALSRVSVARLVRDTARQLDFNVTRSDLDDYAEVQGQVLRQVMGYEGSNARVLRSLVLSHDTRRVALEGQRGIDLGKRAFRRARRVVGTRLKSLPR